MISALCLAALTQISGSMTAAGIAGGTIGVGMNVLASRVDAMLCAVTNATAGQFIRNISEPVNHDLLKGMIAAHQKAFKHYAETLNSQASAIDRPIADKIIALAKKEIPFDIKPTQALMASVSPLLQGPGDTTREVRLNGLVAAAIAELVAWIEKETGETLPSQFQALLTKTAPNGRESWEAKFQLHLAETIKTNDRYSKIFIASSIADLVGRTITIEQLADQLLVGFGALQGKVDVIGAKIHDVDNKMDRALAILEPNSSVKSKPEGPKASEDFNRKKRLAKLASRRRNPKSAARLWSDVAKKAQTEGLLDEALNARIEIALVEVRDFGNIEEGLEIAEACLILAKDVELGTERRRLNQLVGEIYRIKGDLDLARGFLHAALSDARSLKAHGDEGWALLALSSLDRIQSDELTVLDRVRSAYDAFTRLYADGSEKETEDAKGGFATCHSWRAEVLKYSQPDAALAELNAAVAILDSMPKGWEWELGTALAERAEAFARKGESESAITGINDAITQFVSIKNLIGVAGCHLAVAEMIDRAGKREESEDSYRKAAQIANASKNERKAAYYLFRYGMKLIESRNYDEADKIFDYLVDREYIEDGQRGDILFNLCLSAQAQDSQVLLKERAQRYLDFLNLQRRDCKSAKSVRTIDHKIAAALEFLGRVEEARRTYDAILARLNPASEAKEIAECWFQIGNLMQKVGDKDQERRAYENALSIGGEDLNSVMRQVALLMLAQLNIKEDKYNDGLEKLDIASNIDANNPLIKFVGKELYRDLPKLTSDSRNVLNYESIISSSDIFSYIYDLEKWTLFNHAQRKSVLAIWYYINRNNLWSNLKSSLGTKFLISVSTEKIFENVRQVLWDHGDIFVWGLNFCLKGTKGSGIKRFDFVRAPEDFVFPASVTFVGMKLTPEGDNSTEEAIGDRMLKPSAEGLDFGNTPYYATVFKDESALGGISPLFFGPKQNWSDARVTSFMLRQSADQLAARKSICLPVSENDRPPSLERVMEVARTNDVIPVFFGQLPQGSRVVSVCDGALELLLADSKRSNDAKVAWEKLLVACHSAPKLALSEFVRTMEGLNVTNVRGKSARVYALRIPTGSGDVVHPALVIF